MALGASRGRVVGTVVVHALTLVAVGVALGSSLAWYLSETARAFLFGIGPTDPRACKDPNASRVRRARS